ncbi:hypothetical protein [Microbacterium marinilacus]|uniref:CU044_5270 family protein n=1 Tax=Microbacterium marinilacus TaxID=415209 RepID=A0ABP7BK39_9MICO|nr:hypothetical protein [Microbacterium marinilacus]MBY0687685.1 hypothetical protein [Microbacterium marinilacus]
MSTREDDLDRLFRAAAPERRSAATARSAADVRLRESIIRGAAAPRRAASRTRTRALWAGASTAVAAVTIGVLAAVGVLSPSPRAVALTPPPLQYSDAGSLDDVLDDALVTLAAQDGPEQERQVQTIVWAWSAEIEQEHVEVVPQEITYEWTEDGGARTTIVAAPSFWDDGDRPDGVDASPYEPGELIDEVVTEPADFAVPEGITGLSGSSRDEISAALEVFGWTDGASSGELLVAFDGLLQHWTLSNAQEATMLEMLRDAGGLEVRGTATDRLGREVVGIGVASTSEDQEDTVLIDAETGRLAGVENELTEPVDPLPAGVISYTLWDVDP